MLAADSFVGKTGKAEMLSAAFLVEFMSAAVFSADFKHTTWLAAAQLADFLSAVKSAPCKHAVSSTVFELEF